MTEHHAHSTRHWLARCCTVALAFLSLLAHPASPACAEPDTDPMRIALVCGGNNDDFFTILLNVARELKTLGITRHAPPSSLPRNDTPGLWQWLCDHAGGGQVAFLPDGFYAADWNQEKRTAQAEAVRTRLVTRKDVDVILALGTWAGLDMAALNTTVPVVVSGVTDAVSAGIVASPTHSGKDNLVAVVEADRFLRQMELFHKVFDYRRLGVTYTDTSVGRSVAAIDQIEAACERQGVELVRCTGNFNIFHNAHSEEAAREMEACHREFVKKRVDAVYITYNSLSSWQLLRALEPLVQANIPTISQTGPSEVQVGALASVTSYSAKEGRFVAHLLQQLLAGAVPRVLSQHFSSPMLLAINVRTASRIGWSPSLEVLLSVDEFFQ